MFKKSISYGSLTALIAAAALSCGAAQAEPLFAFLSPASQGQIAGRAAIRAGRSGERRRPLDPRLQRQIAGPRVAGMAGSTAGNCISRPWSPMSGFRWRLN